MIYHSSWRPGPLRSPGWRNKFPSSSEARQKTRRMTGARGPSLPVNVAYWPRIATSASNGSEGATGIYRSNPAVATRKVRMCRSICFISSCKWAMDFSRNSRAKRTAKRQGHISKRSPSSSSASNSNQSSRKWPSFFQQFIRGSQRSGFSTSCTRTVLALSVSIYVGRSLEWQAPMMAESRFSSTKVAYSSSPVFSKNLSLHFLG